MTRRLATALGIPTALVLAVGVGYAAGRGTTAPSGAGTTHDLAHVNNDLAAATSCDDLLDSYVRRGVEAVTAFGWDPGWVTFDTAMSASDARVSGAETAAGRATYSTPRTGRATGSATGTNVQEAGVDEPDVVKTDGKHLYRVWDDVLEVYDVSGDEPVRVGQLELDEVRDAETLLAGDRLVVAGRDRVEEEFTRVLSVDVADPAEPTVVDDRLYAARLLEARLHGGPEGTVRLVLTPYLPDLDFVQPRRKRSWREAERMNREVVRQSDIEDWLPTVDGEPLLGCEDVAVPADDDAPLGTVAVVAFGAGDPEDARATGVAAGGQVAYFSQDRMYLAEQSFAWGCCWAFDGPGTSGRVAMPVGEDDGVTQVFAFALDGDRTTYVASGEVEGALADRWSMDSVDAVLRLAVGPTHRTGVANSVVTLREDGDELVEAGRLDGLGRGEDIKSVRWFDDLAIVVTFRQVDPLYTVDLSDVDDPTLLGELKIPGFSEYLHPLGPHRMIGIGQDADRRGWTRGAQAALLDVHDLTRTRQLDVVAYPRGSQAGVATDPRQFTWLPEQRTALTVVSKGWRGRVGWLSVLRVEGGELHSRLVAVEDGAEVAAVRTVPLPDGRVVLVTSKDVRVLDLG
jgi:hypothetical protein